MAISPLNYPGNKAKVISELLGLFPQKISDFIDVFCGSGIVSVNSSSTNLYCNDFNPWTIELLEYFYYTNTDEIVSKTEEWINRYNLTYSRKVPKGTYVEHKHEGLSRYNKSGFQELKKDFNTDHDVSKLFVLIIYGFNHYLRFNGQGIFNVPVGKVDFSSSIYKHTIEFSDLIKTKKIIFSCSDFRAKSLYKNHDKNSLFYFDPPYLVTTAPYNDKWGEEEEKALLKILDTLNEKGMRFALSNVLFSNGKRNTLLEKWCSSYSVHTLHRQYRNANYQKVNVADSVEVLITNY